MKQRELKFRVPKVLVVKSDLVKLRLSGESILGKDLVVRKCIDLDQQLFLINSTVGQINLERSQDKYLDL